GRRRRARARRLSLEATALRVRAAAVTDRHPARHGRHSACPRARPDTEGHRTPLGGRARTLAAATRPRARLSLRPARGGSGRRSVGEQAREEALDAGAERVGAVLHTTVLEMLPGALRRR